MKEVFEKITEMLKGYEDYAWTFEETAEEAEEDGEVTVMVADGYIPKSLYAILDECEALGAEFYFKNEDL